MMARRRRLTALATVREPEGGALDRKRVWPPALLAGSPTSERPRSPRTTCPTPPPAVSLLARSDSKIGEPTSHYETVSPSTPDSAFIEALGGAPLIVSGIYDLTRIQRLLFKRLADATDVRMLLVAPSNDPASPPRRTVSAIRRELNVRVTGSQFPPANVAPDHYFSVGDPTAESDESPGASRTRKRRHRLTASQPQRRRTDRVDSAPHWNVPTSQPGESVDAN